MESPKRRRCRELAKSSSFCRAVYSQIEEVGWEHLVHLAGDLKFFSFRVIDSRGRANILEIRLGNGHPQCQPSISADVPFLFDIEWTAETRLIDLVHQFQEHLERLHELWSTLDEIDNNLCTADMQQPSRSLSSRQIELGDDCFILLSIDARDPRSLPECRFVGSGPTVSSLREMWRRNSGLWKKDKTFLENLEFLLKRKLPATNGQENDEQIECGICYSRFLPIDEELGCKSGTGMDYTCENSNCNRGFHSVCLEDWLRSITTTRQSFGVLFGNCPYCSEPVTVKINSSRH